MMILLFLMILLSALVAWQDFRFRAVSWVLFPMLVILIIGHAWAIGTFSVVDWLVNMLLLLLQLFFLQVFCFIKYRHLLMEGERYLGWGDVLFFGVLTCCFSPMNYLLFNLLSFVLILVLTILYRMMGGTSKQIPLAGGQALALALLLVVNYGNMGRNLYNDDYILSLLPWG